jgi:myosin heavy subunit
VLVYGFADQLDMIDVDLVDEMVLERMKDSVVPIVNRDVAETDNKQASKELEQDFPWIRPAGGVQGLIAKTENPAVKKKPVIKEPVKQASSIVDGPAVSKSADKAVVTDDKSSYVNRGKEKPVEPEKKTKMAGLPSLQKAPQKAPQKFQDNNLAPSSATQVEGKTGKSLLKYGIFSAFILVVLIVLALLFSGKISTGEIINWASNKQAETNRTLELQKLHKQEEARLKKLQIEAEALKKQRELEEALVKKLQTEAQVLKKEREAAIAKAEEEKRAKQQAEKLAAEKAALAVKAAEKKSKLEEKKRLAQVKKRQRLAKQREAKVRAEADRVKRERQEMQRQQKLLQEQEAKNRAEQLAAAKAKEAELLECSGPEARYKANCR